MTSFSAAVQWWEYWQLRLLVLASLFFQYFLFAAAVVRKRRVPHWFRALIWLAYLGGDVVAVYALATLFNRHHKEEEALASSNPATAHLETLWAPILLLHLGGQDGITAYSIEDNENWRRHLLVSVSQITVAIYVFRKSWWSGDKVLLRAAILLFVPGILKCLEKPWALMNATVTSIMNSDDSQMMEATLYEDDGVQKDDIHSLEKYVQEAARSVAELEAKPVDELIFYDEVADHPYHLFVDLGHPYSTRLRNLQLVARAAIADVHGLVRSSLSKAFDRLYTKHKTSFGGLLRAAVALVALVVIGLFHKSHRGVYDRADVVVTYVLLGCTAALELVSACLVLGSGLPPPDDQLAQYDLVGYLARGEKHPRFSALARRLQLDRHWCTAAPEPSVSITRLVYDHVADGWKDYIRKSLHKHDATTGKCKPTAANGVRAYQRFNDSRGQRTLEREGCIGVGRSAIEESLRMPFDESVLLWHLATEFCYFDHVDTGHDATRHSRMVSNYMAYLLFVKPEMLIPGARSKLFRATYHELRKILKPPQDDEESVELEPMEKKATQPRRAKNEMVREVIQKVKSTMGLGSEDLVHKAWAVAHELMEFAKEKERDFIQEQRERADRRKQVIQVLGCAKEKADEFTDIKNKDRHKILNNLMEFMDSAQKKAHEFIGVKSNNTEEEIENKKIFIKYMKEAKEKAESFINDEKAKKQTKEAMQCAKNKAEDFIKYEEEKKGAEVPMGADEVREKEKVLMAMVTEFSNNAKKFIHWAEVEKKELMDEGGLEKKLMDGRTKAKEFINGANEFISEEKEKNQTEEERKITDILEAATKAAYEFIKSEQKMAVEPSWKPTNAMEEEKLVLAAKEFSKQAEEAMKLVEEEDMKLTDLMARNLIANKEELCMIRGREHADDKMWAVIQGVWVEMLCFSASRCRGYLHAKSLSNGGEYLSYVWLLLYYMGMETMPERMQRPELPAVGDTGALVRTPTDKEWDEEPAPIAHDHSMV